MTNQVAAQNSIFEGPPTKDWAVIVWVVGLIVTCASLNNYFSNGYNDFFSVMWLTGMLLMAVFYWTKRRTITKSFFTPIDAAILLLLTGFAALLYLPYLYEFPMQVNTDEFVILDYIVSIQGKIGQIDPLGPSDYFAFPSLIHLLFANLAQQMGAISFLHLRQIHAMGGVLCVSAAYIFFRALGMDKRLSSGATLLVGTNHALLAISRMVSRNNTSLLIELSALTVLFRALKNRCPFLMHLGGIIAGLSFYTYTPARTTFPSFLLATLLIAFFARKQNSFSAMMRLVFPAFLAFLLTIAPMIIATAKVDEAQLRYQQDQFLFTEGGLKVQKDQVWAKSYLEGYIINVENGLLAFNFPIQDHGNIYENPRQGFVDCITGVMIWIGMLALIFQRHRRLEEREADILCTSTFLALWLVFAFVITFAPNFTRLFTTLPFVAYLAINGIDYVSMVLSRIFEGRPYKRSALRSGIFWTLTYLIAAVNLVIIAIYFDDGIKNGNLTGSTYRYTCKRLDEVNRTFVISQNDDDLQYYLWGNDETWREWMVGDALLDRAKVIPPKDLAHELEGTLIPAAKPITLFVHKTLWERVKPICDRHGVHYEIAKMLPDGSRLAIDLQFPR